MGIAMGMKTVIGAVYINAINIEIEIEIKIDKVIFATIKIIRNGKSL